MSDITLTPSMRANLLSLQGTSMLMDTTQRRISTGLKVGTALDSPTAFFTAKGLTNTAADLGTLKDSMGQGISTIESADKALTSITDLVEQMKGLTASAKGANSPDERATLAAQYDALRTQIDALAADATYSGKNLVSGRGVITGGTFLDTISATETALGGVSTGGIVRTGTDTNIGDYAITVQEKVNDLNSVIAGTTNTGGASTAVVQTGAGGSTTADNDSLQFFVDGVSVGSAAIGTAASDTFANYATAISDLSSDLTATVATTGELTITVTEGKVLEIRENVATNAGALLADLGLTAGLQNDTTGAQVVDLTSDLGIYGAEVYAHVSGYTNDSDSTQVSFSVSGTTLTVTDGTTGSTATLDTAVFSAAGKDTLSVGDLTVNFVTSLATEQTNTAPAVDATIAAAAQSSTVAWQAATALAQTDTVTIAGSYEIGDIANLTINTTTYTHTVVAGDDATSVALALHNDVNGGSLPVTSTVSNGVITLTADTAGTAYTTSSSVTDKAVDATQTLTQAITVAGTQATAQITSFTITATGGVGGTEAGDIYTAILGGTTFAFTTVSGTTGVTGAAAGLVLAIDADGAYTSTNTNGVITVTAAVAGTSFSAAVAVVDGGGGGAQAISAPNTTQANVVNLNETGTVVISGAIEAGDVFNIIVNANGMAGTNAGLTTVSYTAVESDTVSLVAAGLNTALQANALVTSGDVTSSVTTDTVTIVGTGFVNFTAFAANGSTVNETTAAMTSTDNNTQANVTGYESGDEITVVINGNSYAYALTANAATETAAATAYLSAMKATIEAAENVTITDAGTPNGTLTLLSDTAGDVFTISSTQTTSATDTEGDPTVATGTANAVQTTTVTIPANIDDGDTYSVTVNGNTVSYTALTTDTSITDIAVGLTAALNANTTLVNGSSGLIATATEASGVITIAENAQGSVLTISATAGDAAITLGNESNTTSTQGTLKSMTTGTVTGDARIKVTSGGITETVNIDTDSTVANTVSNAAWGSAFTFTADDSQMKAGETSTISVTNPTGSGAQDMKIFFNGDSTAFVNTTAVDATSSGLGVIAAANAWVTDADIDTSISNLSSATDTLRSSAQALSTNLGIIQTREDFTSEFINVLQAGSDKLILADANLEASNMLALQTRQQLGIQSLSMASQAAQSVLSLFR